MREGVLSCGAMLLIDRFGYANHEPSLRPADLAGRVAVSDGLTLLYWYSALAEISAATSVVPLPGPRYVNGLLYFLSLANIAGLGKAIAVSRKLWGRGKKARDKKK